MCQILDDILQGIANQEHVKMKDPGRVLKLIKDVIQAGPNALQVITDFDMTLTRYHADGVKCDTCHGVIQKSPLMSDEFRSKSEALFEKYYPIEIDHNLSIEEKIPQMIKWYEESHEVLTTYPLMKQDLRTMVDNSRIFLRDGAVEMLKRLNEENVPVMVFSAGVGDVLEEVLWKYECYHPNTKVVSNCMVFNEEGRCVGFKDPLIHMYNKNEKAVKGSLEPKYFQELSHRSNVLLLGDSLGDVDMVDGVPNPGAVLKVGFLNANIEDRLESFMEVFDIVLIDDQSMKIVSSILDRVLDRPFSIEKDS